MSQPAPVWSEPHTWDVILRNVGQGIGALSDFFSLAFMALLIIWFIKRAATSNSETFDLLFHSRKSRIERRYLIYRGKHYPKKTIRVKTQRFLRDLGRHKWGR